KLNKLPEVRTFLKEAGHADSYDGLTITWTSGKSPTLHIKGANGETSETIDLSEHTTDRLHELMAAKGFKRRKVEL
ncbi:hypothetical protein B484DRAFT_323572, partial [Ochromonadaceae sp. CCMP2298]